MEFFTTGNSRMGFRSIHPLLAELIRGIPEVIEPGKLTETTEQRFYPEPTNSDEEDQLRSDWKAFVEPGLQEHFRSSRDVVIADLKGLIEKRDTFEISIPTKHADAWLNALNQARLALAADLGFDESLLSSTEPPDLVSDRGLTLFRINLYAFMQQCLLEQLD